MDDALAAHDDDRDAGPRRHRRACERVDRGLVRKRRRVLGRGRARAQQGRDERARHPTSVFSTLASPSSAQRCM
jgi:hypothetical protein